MQSTAALALPAAHGRSGGALPSADVPASACTSSAPGSRSSASVRRAVATHSGTPLSLARGADDDDADGGSSPSAGGGTRQKFRALNKCGSLSRPSSAPRGGDEGAGMSPLGLAGVSSTSSPGQRRC